MAQKSERDLCGKKVKGSGAAHETIARGGGDCGDCYLIERNSASSVVGSGSKSQCRAQEEKAAVEAWLQARWSPQNHPLLRPADVVFVVQGACATAFAGHRVLPGPIAASVARSVREKWIVLELVL